MNPSSPTLVYILWSNWRTRCQCSMCVGIFFFFLVYISAEILEGFHGDYKHHISLYKCIKWRNEHKVIVQYSWGNLSTEMRKEWRKHRCDEILIRNGIGMKATTKSATSKRSSHAQVKADYTELFEPSYNDLSYRKCESGLNGSLLENIE